jgi:hypothetical protein
MTYLLTHYTESWQPLIDIVKPIHERYCEKHGYKYVLKKVPDYWIYTGLEKLGMVLENITEMDIALVLDADVMITNHNIKITDFIPYGEIIILSKGLNMGAFIIRGYRYCISFIKLVMLLIEKRVCNCEQDAVELISKIEIMDFYVHNHPCFNSYMSELYPEIKQPVTEKEGQWIKGKSFILHLPGISMSERLRIFNEIKEKIVYE